MEKTGEVDTILMEFNIFIRHCSAFFLQLIESSPEVCEYLSEI